MIKFTKEDSIELDKLKFMFTSEDPDASFSVKKMKDWLENIDKNKALIEKYLDFYNAARLTSGEPVIYNSKTYLLKYITRKYTESEDTWKWASCTLIDSKGTLLKDVPIEHVAPYTIANKILFTKGDEK